jgi:diguanylate cyclase (GGDEF)-like protein
MRQNLPRCFKPDSPVKCPVDAAISLSGDHPAYCIPMTVSRQTQLLVHMMLPIAAEWTEERKQLAQAYVNSATSVLVSLHLLAEAEKQSLTDPLTGLYNRRSLDQFLAREIALAERHHHPLSMVMLDMDHFKTVNDEHGHAAGDHLLRAFADCVRITLRKTDLAFRFGGDEFAIVLPQTGIVQAQQVVTKLRQAFSAIDFTDAVANLKAQPTLSIGVAERSKAMNVLTMSQLLSAADQALYQAKQSRNCTSVYTPQAA